MDLKPLISCSAGKKRSHKVLRDQVLKQVSVNQSIPHLYLKYTLKRSMESGVISEMQSSIIL